MNLKQIRGTVKNITGADAATTPDAAITYFINLAQNELAREILALKNSASVTCVATTQEYALPADFHKAIQMKVDGVVLRYISEEDTEKLFSDTADSGAPYYYYIDRDNDTYGFYPVPDSAYTGTFRYFKTPTALSNDTDTPDFPAAYHDALVLGTASRVFQQMQKYEESVLYLKQYNDYVAKIMNDMGSDQASTGPVQTLGADILDVC